MPLNQRKVIEILLEEVGTTEDRCEGYRDLLRETIAEIVEAERLHRERATTIQKDINDKCNAASRWLVEHQSDGERTALTGDDK